MAGFDSRIEALAAFAEGKTAIVGLVTSGGLNVLGNDGRCSMIGREIGFENIGVDAEIDTATHGNEASFEFIVEKDPDYLFILDRDAAIQTEGAQRAARAGNRGERTGQRHPRLPGRPHRLSGPPRRLVHRRGRRHCPGRDAGRSGRSAGVTGRATVLHRLCTCFLVSLFYRINPKAAAQVLPASQPFLHPAAPSGSRFSFHEIITISSASSASCPAISRRDCPGHTLPAG